MMKIAQPLLDQYQELNRQRFEQIRDREFKPAFDVPGLKYLRDKARNERDIRELYRGRAPYELLQNADDAGAVQVTYILSRSGMAFAHDGRWFSVDNFRSLADGWSDKKAGECIGHKGIGFRSVLDITPAPHLLRVDTQQFFAVKFGWALNNGHIQNALAAKPDLYTDYRDWQKSDGLVCPIMAIPGLVKKSGLDAGAALFDDLVNNHYGNGYTTMFWFPASDTEIDKRTLRDLSPNPLVSDVGGINTLRDFLRYEVSQLLPFLATVERVSLWDQDQFLCAVALNRGETGAPAEVEVCVDLQGTRQTQTYFQMPFTFSIPQDIASKADTPQAVRGMQTARVVLLVRLIDGQPIHTDEAQFHVYFPTEEKTCLGFVVHGDFHVKPDRVRLMDSNYNDWLLGKVAQAVANEFLSELLNRYVPRAVFEAVAPTHNASTPAEKKLGQWVSNELHNRRPPFVPTATGLARPQDTLLPAVADRDGFWNSHFTAALHADLTEGPAKSFVHSDIDTPRVRVFLQMAGVQELKALDFLDLMEKATIASLSSQWWAECYAYLASEQSHLASKPHSFFQGRRLLPTAHGGLATVPGDGEHIVCLPPSGASSTLTVPSLFSNVFELLSAEVAQELAAGTTDIRDWVLTHLHVTRFEATDLLPRAIRSTVSDIFSGTTSASMRDLVEAWVFIKAVIDSSRMSITSPDFIQNLGRFPVPLEETEERRSALPGARSDLAPAFLAFWPEQIYGQKSCLSGLSGFRRMRFEFLQDLTATSTEPREDWLHFFKILGVSAAPKLLVYKRLAVGGDDVVFAPTFPKQANTNSYTGDRQTDENRTFIQAIASDPAWLAVVNETPLCQHEGPQLLQSMAVLEGLTQCVKQAEIEYAAGEPSWQPRLERLIHDLVALHDTYSQVENSVFCRSKAHTSPIRVQSLIQLQLCHHRWLPTTLGPATTAESFVRLASRHMISSGAQGEALGDSLIPYVIADTLDEEARLQRLGVAVLEDTNSASTTALISALQVLGEKLSSEWGQEKIIATRNRWRLVRGAIQDIYRTLNQRTGVSGFASDARFAVRTADGINFEQRPLYFAEPGSPLEQAFITVVPLIDADRRYRALFDSLGIVSLIAGETVNENLVSEDQAIEAEKLQQDIIECLGPYLLAAVLARSQTSNPADTTIRRLRERFCVKASQSLTVRLSLISNQELSCSVEFPKFYLQRRLEAGRGATQEAYYTLFYRGSRAMSLLSSDLDADALGTALVPVFAAEASEELSGLFPRIVSRYHYRGADAAEMSEYLYHQLGIGHDVQDLARALIFGEAKDVTVINTPPMRIIPLTHSRTNTPTVALIEEKLQQHQESITAQTSALQEQIDELIPDSADQQKPAKVTDMRTGAQRIPVAAPTAEQQMRGRQGEEEIKRRLQEDEGWAGFTLLKDVRDEGCGYDFLCTRDDHHVFIEVKTFTRNGYVSVTSNELKVAASKGRDYYLIGVLAEESEGPYLWQTSQLQDPILKLIADGAFRIHAELRTSAAQLFDLMGSLEEPLEAEATQD